MIGDDIAAALPELRAQAESLMTLTLTAYAPTKGDVEGYGWDEILYEAQEPTPGKVQGTSATGRDTIARTVMVNQVPRPVIEGGLQIPLSSYVDGGVLPIVASEQRGVAWEFEVVGVGRHDDPPLLGRRFMVVNCPAKSYATARRMDVVEVPAPEEA